MGGDLALHPLKGQHAIEEKIAHPLGLDKLQAALGIHQVVDENVANAARVHCIERGYDPSQFLLIAFGGVGPLHAFWVPEKLKIGQILFPIGAALALGFLRHRFLLILFVQSLATWNYSTMITSRSFLMRWSREHEIC